MTQIIEIIKVNEDKENITFTFTVQKDMVDGFIKVLHGFHEATQHICYKMRNSEEKQRAAREARDREVKRQFDMIKEHIRKAYYKHYEATDDVRQSFKLTRLEYMAHNHLVARVRKEFKDKRDLEILRMNNAGFSSEKISAQLGVSPGYVRKAVWSFKQSLKTP